MFSVPLFPQRGKRGFTLIELLVLLHKCSRTQCKSICATVYVPPVCTNTF